MDYEMINETDKTLLIALQGTVLFDQYDDEKEHTTTHPLAEEASYENIYPLVA